MQEQPPQKPDGPQGTRIFRFKDVPLTEYTDTNLAASTTSAKLFGVSKPYTGKEFKLHSGKNSIGRDNDNDIVLDNPTVSVAHARIVSEKNEWRIVNLLSSNGTFVNGRKITQRSLRHGDQIRFGEVIFYFEATTRNARVRSFFWGVLALTVTGAIAFLLLRKFGFI